MYTDADLQTLVQPSRKRIFSDREYHQAGARVQEDLSAARVILGVKEIPPDFFQPGVTYLFFSHTIKGQSQNLAMLRRMMELKCNLIDYERIVDERNRRLIFFGRYAGLAGMIETFYAFGQKLRQQGHATPLEALQPVHRYGSITAALEAFQDLGVVIRTLGFPAEISPVVVGFSGYGNVSRGAQEVFDLLPHHEISPAGLGREVPEEDRFHLYKVVFKEEDLMRPKSGPFELQDYYQHPEKYESQFSAYLPFLSLLVNCIFWTPDYPRLITREGLRIDPPGKLAVIGDISCDLNGSIEITSRVTDPGQSTFTYFPESERYLDGTAPGGITVMAVDILPGVFPHEASDEFSRILRDYLPALVQTDFETPYENLNLPAPLKRALILQRGELTGDYQYMHQFIDRRPE